MQSIYTNGILLDHRRNGVLIHTTRMSLENIMPSLKNQSQNTMSSTILFIFPEQGNLFPGGSEGQESACNAGDLGSIPESGRSTGEGNGNPLQSSCLENPIDRGESPWTKKPGRLQSMGHKESETTGRLTHSLHFHRERIVLYVNYNE